MHPRRVRFIAALALATVVGLNAGVATAATTVSYGASGIEVYATATRGVFAGAARATDDYGAWSAVIDHSVFDSARTATITAGRFDLNGYRRDISGTFNAGGVVRLRWADAGCGREVFDVDGTLTLAAGGTGVFDATLVHYRTSVFGRCITYGATVSATVTFTLP